MVFSSLLFLYAFFSISLLVYAFCRDRRSQNVVLLIFSLVFYAWGEPKYVLLLMFMALTSWICALGVSKAESAGRRKLWLGIAAVIDIGLIGWFKYAGMISGIFGPVPEFIARIALPIGISFYTFQLLTYVVDVYRGEASAQKSYWNVLLYAALFHQCIAGPIVRYKTIDQELFGSEPRVSEWAPGVSRFCAGLAKKVLLANPCGALADALILAESTASDAALFAQNAEALSSVSVLGAWIGVLAYSLQLYLDFSAYSDMAIGMGRMLGLHYPENFNYPYISKSVTEFWRRWHVSLGTFFRDYVYIPLGGNRRHQTFNMFVVWSLTGLWHGASWNFLLWGMYFFVLLYVEKKNMKRLEQLPAAVRHLITMILVVFGWVLFYCVDLGQLWKVLGCMFGLYGAGFSDYSTGITLTNNIPLLLLGIVASTALPRTIGNIAKSFCMRKNSHPIAKRGYVIAVGLMDWAILFLCLISLIGSSYNPFLYFRF